MSQAMLLFAEQGFFKGMAAIFDLGSTLTVYNDSANSEEADYNALRSDWVAVGQDIKKSMEQWRLDYASTKKEKR